MSRGEGRFGSGAGWRLLSAVERRGREGPTFEIPEAEARASLRPGDGAKLLFELRSGVERMWVVVLERREGGYLGRLTSTPAEEDAPVARGLDLEFRPEHVAAIDDPPFEYLERELPRELLDRVSRARRKRRKPRRPADRWTLGLIFVAFFLLGGLFRSVLMEGLRGIVSGMRWTFGW